MPLGSQHIVRRDAEAEAGAGGHVHAEVREAQRFDHQVVGEDLRAEVLAAPAERAQAGEGVQVRGGADRALEQAAAVEADAGRFLESQGVQFWVQNG